MDNNTQKPNLKKIRIERKFNCINKCTEPSVENDSVSLKSDSMESQQNIIIKGPTPARLPLSNIYSLNQYSSHLKSDVLNSSQDGLDNEFVLNDSFNFGDNAKSIVRDKHGHEAERDLRTVYEPVRPLDDSKMFDIPHQINYNKEYAGRDTHRYYYTVPVVFTIFLGYFAWVACFYLADHWRFADIKSFELASTHSVILWNMYFVAFTFLFCMIWVSFYKVYYTDSGCVPRNNFLVHYNQYMKKINAYDVEKYKIITHKIYKYKTQFRDFRHLRPKYLIERFLTQKERFCQMCTSLKPDRTHHCKVCKRCVLRFDHHCPWIANCIGYHNYKYFICLVFYCSISMTLVALTQWYTLAYFIEQAAAVKSQDPYLIFFIVFFALEWAYTVGLGGVLVWFSFYHVMLMGNNFTTCEYIEKSVRKYYNVSPYSRGLIYNITYVLPYFILWPYQNDRKEYGVSYRLCDHYMKKVCEEIKEYNKSYNIEEDVNEDYENMSIVSVDQQFHRVYNVDHLNFNQ